MKIILIISFILLVFGILMCLGLTPSVITEDILSFITPKYSLRDRARISQGKKKTNRIASKILRIRDVMEATGQTKKFTTACALTVFLSCGGCILSLVLGNAWIIPVVIAAGLIVPFIYASNAIEVYDRHVEEELETALGIITNSYIRTENIITAVNENIGALHQPVKNIFQSFITDATLVSANITEALERMKSKINNSIFEEWCDALIACQENRSQSDTLQPIVSKLTDVRIVNSDFETRIAECRKEYWTMVGMVIMNIPLLWAINRDWYKTLMHTMPGKITLAVCAAIILITFLFMIKYTRRIKYKK